MINVSSTAAFDIKLKVTTTNGDTEYGLVSDFGPAFGASGSIPAGNYSDSFDLLSCYTWNNVLPADGMSTVKTVTVKLSSAGSLRILASQLTNTTYGGYFADGVEKWDTTPRTVLRSDVYAVENGYISGVKANTTLDAWMANIDSAHTVTVYEKGSAVSGETLAKTGQIVKVTSGDTVLAEYTVVVKGDTLGTGKISTSGMRAILKFTMNGDSFSDVQKLAADADDNGIVNTNDVRQLLILLNS